MKHSAGIPRRADLSLVKAGLMPDARPVDKGKSTKGEPGGVSPRSGFPTN